MNPDDKQYFLNGEVPNGEQGTNPINYKKAIDSNLVDLMGLTKLHGI